MKPNIEELRKKYLDNPPEGMTSKDIRLMSEDELLDMDYFLNDDELDKNGADEIDMVINIGHLKDKKYDLILEEIKAIHKACNGKILKVIIETCLLTEEEKIKMCEIVTESGAEYIKTSTGFSTSGATFEDMALMKKYVGKDVKIKAAGGITSFADAEKFIELGADRLGTSRLIKLVKE